MGSTTQPSTWDMSLLPHAKAFVAAPAAGMVFQMDRSLPLVPIPHRGAAPSVTTKRFRSHISEGQKQKLTKAFETVQHPSNTEAQALADALEMPIRTVQVWFQNRRARAARMSSKQPSAPCPPSPEGTTSQPGSPRCRSEATPSPSPERSSSTSDGWCRPTKRRKCEGTQGPRNPQAGFDWKTPELINLGVTPHAAAAVSTVVPAPAQDIGSAGSIVSKISPGSSCIAAMPEQHPVGMCCAPPLAIPHDNPTGALFTQRWRLAKPPNALPANDAENFSSQPPQPPQPPQPIQPKAQQSAADALLMMTQGWVSLSA